MQVARQKAELLPRLDGRTGQDDAADILGLERLDRHCHSQIRLAGACWPDAERDGIFADGGEIFLLAQRLGVDGTTLGRDCDEIVGQLPQALFLTPVGQADAVAHGLLLKRGVVFHQGDHAVHGAGGGVHILLLTGKAQHRAAADRRDAEFLFQQVDILVAAAKDGCCQFNAVQFQRSFCQIFILPVPWCST